MEFFRFIFSSFWIWLGFTTIICIIGYYLVELVKSLRHKRTVNVYEFQDVRGRHVEIIAASDDDVKKVLDGQEVERDG